MYIYVNNHFGYFLKSNSLSGPFIHWADNLSHLSLCSLCQSIHPFTTLRDSFVTLFTSFCWSGETNEPISWYRWNHQWQTFCRHLSTSASRERCQQLIKNTNKNESLNAIFIYICACACLRACVCVYIYIFIYIYIYIYTHTHTHPHTHTHTFGVYEMFM